MDPIQKNVTVELRTIIDDHGQMEYNKQKQSGKFYRKNDMNVLTFDEEIEDQATIKNLITIQKDKVSIKRTGLISMNQQFRHKQLTENVYKHPHGTIHMETFTDNIRYKANRNDTGGKLTMTYRVKLNGQEERKHKLELIFSEEDLA